MKESAIHEEEALTGDIIKAVILIAILKKAVVGCLIRHLLNDSD
jgi:hypothetical protein